MFLIADWLKNSFKNVPIIISFIKENSSVGRTVVSKTKGQGFKSLFSCNFSEYYFFLKKDLRLYINFDKSPKIKTQIKIKIIN